MYLIYGDDAFAIEKEINNIIKVNSVENVVHFNDESLFSSILDSLINTYLFDDKKMIILDNIYFNEEQNKRIIEALKQQEVNLVVFVFNCKKDDLNIKNLLISFLLKNANSLSFIKIEEKKIPDKIVEIVSEKGGKISKFNAIYLASKLPNEMLIIVSEIEKLLINNLEITEESIDELVTIYQGKNLFGFLNALNSKDIHQVFKEYQEKINEGEEITSLVSSISTILITASITYLLKEQKKSLKEIAEIMNIHIFRIENANKLIIRMGIKKINDLIFSLAKLDLEIKNGMIEDKIGFEKILLDFVR